MASHMTSGVAIGAAGTQLTLALRGTIAVDPASLAATTAADTSITIPGVAVGDSVVLNPPAAGLTAGMLVAGAWVSAANTVKVRLYNTTVGAIDEASAVWSYAIFRS